MQDSDSDVIICSANKTQLQTDYYVLQDGVLQGALGLVLQMPLIYNMIRYMIYNIILVAT